MQHHDIFELIVQMNIDYVPATLDQGRNWIEQYLNTKTYITWNSSNLNGGPVYSMGDNYRDTLKAPRKILGALQAPEMTKNVKISCRHSVP